MADLTKCRGCGKPLFDTNERNNRAVSIQFGTLEGDKESPQWSSPAPMKNTWGRMHERCFLLVIGDRRGVELAARHAG
jgi:hypothetical protein